MLEKLFSSSLEKVLVQYFEDFGSESFKIGTWKGDIALENLFLKKEVFANFGLPLLIERGWIGSIRAKIPWKSLSSKPAQVSIDKVYILLSPRSPRGEFDSASDDMIRIQKKRMALEAAEKKAAAGKEKDVKQESLISRLAKRIVENAEVFITSVHIMYIDTLSRPGAFICGGIKIGSIMLTNVDEKWQPGFVAVQNSDLKRKLFAVREATIYLQDSKQSLPLFDQDFSSASGEQFVAMIESQFELLEASIIKDLSMIFKIKIQSEQGTTRQTISIESTVDSLNIVLLDETIQNVSSIVSFFVNFYRVFKYRALRPKVPVKGNGAKWWKFAINATLQNVSSKVSPWSWKSMKRRRDNRISFFELSRAILEGNEKGATKAKELAAQRADLSLRRLELSMSIEEIMYLRGLWTMYAEKEISGDSIKHAPGSKSTKKLFRKRMTSLYKSMLSISEEDLTEEDKIEIMDLLENSEEKGRDVVLSFKLSVPSGGIRLAGAIKGQTRQALETKFSGVELQANKSLNYVWIHFKLHELISMDPVSRDIKTRNFVASANLLPGYEKGPFIQFQYREADKDSPQQLRELQMKIQRMDISYNVDVLGIIQDMTAHFSKTTKFKKMEKPALPVHRAHEKIQQALENFLATSGDIKVNVSIASPRILVPNPDQAHGEETHIVFIPGEFHFSSQEPVNTLVRFPQNYVLSVSKTTALVIHSKEDWRIHDLSGRGTRILESFDWSFLLKSKVKRGIEGLQLLSVSGEVNFPRLCFNIWPSKMGLLRSVIQSFSAKKLPKPAPRTKFQGYLKVRASHMNTWSWKWAVLTEKKLSIYSSSTAKKSQVAYKLKTYSRFDTMKGPAGFICVQLLSAQPKIIDDLLLLCPEASAIDWIKHFRSVVFQSLAVMSIDLEEEAETAKEKSDEFYLTALFQWEIKIDYVSFVVQDSHQSSSNKIIAEISGLTLQEQVNEHSHQLDLCIHNLSIRDLVDGAESIVLSTKPAKDNRGLSRSDSHYFRLIITQNWTENWIVEEPNLIVTGRLGTLVVGVDTTFISFAEKLKNLLMPSKEKSFDSPDDDDDVHAEEQSGSDIDESYDIEFIPLISRKFNPISKCKQFSLSIDCLRVQLSLERGSIPWLYGEIRSTTCAADFTARTMNVMACIKSATIWAIQAIPIEGNGALKEVTIFDSSPSNQDVAFLKIMFETYSRTSDFPGMDSRFLYIFGPIKLNLHPEYAYPVIDFLQSLPKKQKRDKQKKEPSKDQQKPMLGLNHLLQVEGDIESILVEFPDYDSGLSKLVVSWRNLKQKTPIIKFGFGQASLSLTQSLSILSTMDEITTMIMDDLHFSVNLSYDFAGSHQQIEVMCGQVALKVCEFHIPLLQKLFHHNIKKLALKLKATKSPSKLEKQVTVEEPSKVSRSIHIRLPYFSILLQYVNQPLLILRLDGIEVGLEQDISLSQTIQLSIDNLSISDMRETTCEVFRSILTPKNINSPLEKREANPGSSDTTDGPEFQLFVEVRSHPTDGMEIAGSLQNLEWLVVPDIIRPLIGFFKHKPTQAAQPLQPKANLSSTLAPGKEEIGDVRLSQSMQMNRDMVLNGSQKLVILPPEDGILREVVIHGRNRKLYLMHSSEPLIYVGQDTILRFEHVTILHKDPIESLIHLSGNSEVMLEPIDGVRISVMESQEVTPVLDNSVPTLKRVVSEDVMSTSPPSSPKEPELSQPKNEEKKEKKSDAKSLPLKWKFIVVEPRFKFPECSTSGSSKVLHLRCNAILSGQNTLDVSSFQLMLQQIQLSLTSDIHQSQVVDLFDPFNIYIDHNAVTHEGMPMSLDVDVEPLTSSLQLSDVQKVIDFVKTSKKNYKKPHKGPKNKSPKQAEPAVEEIQQVAFLNVHLSQVAVVIRHLSHGLDVPLLRLKLFDTAITYTSASTADAKLSASISVDLFQTDVTDWEPIVEPWSFVVKILQIGGDADEGIIPMWDVYAHSKDVLNLNANARVFRILDQVKTDWKMRKDHVEFDEGLHTYYPYWIQNDTGCTLYYWCSEEDTPFVARPGEKIPLSAWAVDLSARQSVKVDEMKAPDILIKISEDHDVFSAVTRISLSRESRTVLERTTLGQEPVVVVAEVLFETSFKVLRIYSSITVSNTTQYPIELLVDSSGTSLAEVGPIGSHEKACIPIYSTQKGMLYFRPGPAYRWSAGDSPLDIEFLKDGMTLVTCIPKQSNTSDTISFIVDVTRQQFTETFLLTLKPVIVIENMLPRGVSLYFTNGEFERRLKLEQGDSYSFYQYDQSKTYFSMTLDGFIQKTPILLCEGHSNFEEKTVQLLDEQGRILDLALEIICESRLCYKYTIFSPYWVHNETDQHLLYGYYLQSRSSITQAAGLGSHGHPPQSDSFLISPPQYTLGSGKLVISTISSRWSEPFAIETVGTTGSVSCLLKDGPGTIVFCIKILRISGKFRRTILVRISAQYMFRNCFDFPLEVKQTCVENGIQLDANQDVPLSHLIPERKPLFHVKNSGESSLWSPSFPICDSSDFLIYLRHRNSSTTVLVRVQMYLESGMIRILIKPPSGIPMYRFTNLTEHMVIYRQKNTPTWTPLLTNRSDDYVWPDPCEAHLLEIFVQGYEGMVLIDTDNVNQSYSLRISKGQVSQTLFIAVVAEGPTKVLRFTDQPSIINRSNTELNTQSLTFRVSAALQGVGLSITTSAPEEVAYLSFRSIGIAWGQSSQVHHFELKIGEIQMDNQTRGAVYPVLLWVKKADEFAVHFSMIESLIYGQVKYYQYLSLLCQEIVLSADSRILYDLFSVLKEKEPSHEPASATKTKSETKSKEDHDVYFELLELHPIRICLNFAPTSSHFERRFKALSRFLRLINRVSNAPLRLNGLAMHHPFVPTRVIVKRVRQHFKRQFLSEVYKLVGATDLLGNPVGLVYNLGQGIFDFFYEPAQGVVNGPEAFARGVFRGTSSLIRGSVHAALCSTAGLTNTLSQGLASIVPDEEPGQTGTHTALLTAKEGIVEGVESLGRGVFEGVTGLVMKPYEGAVQNGVKGFVKGFGKGIVGAAIKPVHGVVDFAAKATTGVCNSTMPLAYQSPKPVRPPRFISSDRKLKVYSQDDAQGQRLLGSLLRENSTREFYVGHYQLDQSGNVCIVTDRSILLTKRSGDRLDQRISLKDIVSVEICSDNQLRLGVCPSQNPGSSSAPTPRIPSETQVFRQASNVVISFEANKQSLLHLFHTLIHALKSEQDAAFDFS